MLNILKRLGLFALLAAFLAPLALQANVLERNISIAEQTLVVSGAEAAGSETSLLQKYVSQAAKQVDAMGMEAFTPAQRAAIARNPNLQAMFRGSQIDKLARNLAAENPALTGLIGKVNKGADFINPSTGQWWDMTTPGQWAAHVKKYGPNGTLLTTQ